MGVDELVKPREKLKERFEIRHEIGRGAQGCTYFGVDDENDQEVAIKELSLGNVADWKGIELFERESQALRSLNHPAIPSYVDAFHVEGVNGERYFLVQEFIEGENLRDLIADGHRFD